MTEQYQTLALTPLRNIIANRMVEAKQTIPHYRLTVDIEMDALLALRKRTNTETPEHKISVNDFVIKASALALLANPEVNIQFVDHEIRQFSQADISVVIAVDGGLSTPVIRNADAKSVPQIAAEVKSLSARAAAGQLKMDEILGGSFSISNLGMYGIEQFDAIINPPQAAILAVGTAKMQPIAKTGEMVLATVMRASLSLDHRVIDGATGAKFLEVLRNHLQHPDSLL